MGKPVTFEQSGKRCIGGLSVLAAYAGAVALIALLHTTGRAAWVKDLSPGSMLLSSGLILANAAAWLAHWSLQSHQLAMEHGMIPKYASHWSTWGWFVPVANFVLPFTILKQRFAAYRLRANKPILWLQALWLGTALLWGWIALQLVPGTFDRWGALATAATALGVWRLRGLVVGLHRVQRDTVAKLAAEGDSARQL
ncbi:MAG: hypothetical protein RL398_2787 [Planctomycetota bacterium]